MEFVRIIIRGVVSFAMLTLDFAKKPLAALLRRSLATRPFLCDKSKERSRQRLYLYGTAR